MPMKPVRALVIGLGVVAAVQLATLLFLRRVERIYDVGQVFPPPFGYSIDMRHLPPVEAPCYLIRVTSDDCVYCRLDQAVYQRVVDEAQRAECQVTEIGPRVGQVAIRPAAEVVQLQYVDMSFARSLDPFATPQTILLDPAGAVVWHRQGALAETDLARAVRDIRRFR